MKNNKTDPGLVVCSACGHEREGELSHNVEDVCPSCGARLAPLYRIIVK